MKKLMILILLLPLFRLSASAETVEGELAGRIGVYGMEQTLDAEAREISGRLITDGSYDVRDALKRLIEGVLERARAELHGSLRVLSSLAALSVLSTVSDSLCPNQTARKYAGLACCAGAAFLLTDGVGSMIDATVAALNELSGFSKTALPALYTAAAAAGALSSSAAKYAAASLSLDIMMSVANRVLIPLIYAYLALSLAKSLFADPVNAAVARLIKWLCGTVMMGMTLLFGAYVGMTDILSSGVDAAAVKTAKAVISTALPVVGGIVSDASAAVVSAAGVLRSSAGVFGLIAVCAICVGPYVALLIRFLLLKAVAAVTEGMPNAGLSALMNDIGTAMAMLLGLLGSGGIMLFISFTAAIRAVRP